MEEKQMMTNEELESQLQSLRGKATIAKILTYGCGAAMILCFITGLIPLAILFIVLALVGGYQLEKNSSRLLFFYQVFAIAPPGEGIPTFLLPYDAEKGPRWKQKSDPA